MRTQPSPQLDLFETSILEQLLSDDHELQRIAATVDWAYVDAETADLYSPGVGRPAYPAQVLFRMLFLEYYATLSDVEVVDQCRYNLLYRVFVGLPLTGPLTTTPRWWCSDGGSGLSASGDSSTGSWPSASRRGYSSND